MTSTKRGALRWLPASAAALALFVGFEAGANVVDGVKTVDGLTIYLGAVPAAIVRGHAAGHAEAQMHGGAPAPGSHAVHLVVAVFDRTGRRITQAAVSARISEPGGRNWNVPLEPMMIDRALTFGGYTSLRNAADYQIDIVVARPLRLLKSQRRTSATAHFTWSHD